MMRPSNIMVKHELNLGITVKTIVPGDRCLSEKNNVKHLQNIDIYMGHQLTPYKI